MSPMIVKNTSPVSFLIDVAIVCYKKNLTSRKKKREKKRIEAGGGGISDLNACTDLSL